MQKRKTKNALPRGAKRISIILTANEMRMVKELRRYWKNFFQRKKQGTITETIRSCLIFTVAQKNIMTKTKRNVVRDE